MYAGRCGKEEFAKDAKTGLSANPRIRLTGSRRLMRLLLPPNAKLRFTTSYGVFSDAGAISLRGRLNAAWVFMRDEADF